MDNNSDNSEDICADDDVYDAILAYLDYVEIKLKNDSNYDPHPIIKAIQLAIWGENKDEGTFMGVAGNGNEETGKEPTELYVAVVKKEKDRFNVLNITDLNTGNEISIYEALLLIELSLKLDKIEGDFVPPDVISSLFCNVLNGITFEFVTPLNYKEARDSFREMLEKQEALLPHDPCLIDSLCKITETTPWEDYDSNVRRIIAVNWAMKNGKNIGLCLNSDEIPKFQITQYFKTIFTGENRDKLLKTAMEKDFKIADDE